MNQYTADLIGNCEEPSAIMTAANNNSVEVDGIRSANYSLKNVTRSVLTRCINSSNYDCVFGIALKSFGMTIDFANGDCSLPRRDRRISIFPIL